MLAAEPLAEAIVLQANPIMEVFICLTLITLVTVHALGYLELYLELAQVD
jgi:hypothetical protein